MLENYCEPTTDDDGRENKKILSVWADSPPTKILPSWYYNQSEIEAIIFQTVRRTKKLMNNNRICVSSSRLSIIESNKWKRGDEGKEKKEKLAIEPIRSRSTEKINVNCHCKCIESSLVLIAIPAWLITDLVDRGRKRELINWLWFPQTLSVFRTVCHPSVANWDKGW